MIQLQQRLNAQCGIAEDVDGVIVVVAVLLHCGHNTMH